MVVVRDIMQTDIVSVPPDMSARQLARRLADEDISGVPVVDEEGTLVGVVSQTDLVKLAASTQDLLLGDMPVNAFAHQGVVDPEPESQFDLTTVEEIMTPAFYAVPADMPVTDLADYLVRGRIQRAVVVEDGRLTGIVTASDIMRAVADGSLLGQATAE